MHDSSAAKTLSLKHQHTDIMALSNVAQQVLMFQAPCGSFVHDIPVGILGIVPDKYQVSLALQGSEIALCFVHIMLACD